MSVTAGDLSRTVFGRRFQNPLLLASGTAGFGRELAGVMELDRLGGLITKAVSLAPRDGNRPPRVAEFRGGMLNSVGLANPGLAHARAALLPWLAANATRAQVLVNVVGFSVEEYAEVVAGLDGAPGRPDSSSTCPAPIPVPAASSSAPIRNASAGSCPPAALALDFRSRPSSPPSCPTSPAWRSWPATPARTRSRS